MSKLVQNYLLQEPIGKGVYGQVYRAIHQKTNNVFAVKVIPKASFRSNPKLQQLAINEINILSSIKHQNIVKFVETLKTPNNFYFVYEYCNQGTLESQLQKKKCLKESEALNYFKQLIEAFKQLNKNNIMHRDLKPDNIFLSDGIIKLGDFGFCKMLEINMAQTMLGSPIYMAPQILKQQIYTSKADIWSLGVVLFEMLFGYCPFESSSISQLINKLKQLQVEIPKDVNPISEEAEILLKKMLVKDQFKRIQWVDLFDFVIDANGKIVSGCKKEFRIETLQNYFFSEGNTENKFKSSEKQALQKIPLKQINSEKEGSINVSSDKKVSRPQSKYVENPKNQELQPEDKHISWEKKNVEYTSYKQIPQFDPNVQKNNGQQKKKNKGISFAQQHKKWQESVRLIQNLALNSVEAEKDQQCMIILLSKLLQSLESETDNHPQWPDIMMQEKKSLRDALNELKRNRQTTSGKDSSENKQNQQRQLYSLWKEARNKFTLQRAIRAVYDQPSRDIAIEEILI